MVPNSCSYTCFVLLFLYQKQSKNQIALLCEWETLDLTCFPCNYPVLPVLLRSVAWEIISSKKYLFWEQREKKPGEGIFNSEYCWINNKDDEFKDIFKCMSFLINIDQKFAIFIIYRKIICSAPL